VISPGQTPESSRPEGQPASAGHMTFGELTEEPPSSDCYFGGEATCNASVVHYEARVPSTSAANKRKITLDMSAAAEVFFSSALSSNKLVERHFGLLQIGRMKSSVNKLFTASDKTRSV